MKHYIVYVIDEKNRSEALRFNLLKNAHEYIESVKQQFYTLKFEKKIVIKLCERRGGETYTISENTYINE